MSKSIGELTVDIFTGAFQKKLRAIAKHTAALAEELERIDESTCPQCGKDELRVTIFYTGGETINTRKTMCLSCGYELVEALGEEDA